MNKDVLKKQKSAVTIWLIIIILIIIAMCVILNPISIRLVAFIAFLCMLGAMVVYDHFVIRKVGGNK